jgi:small subunit ribosomal protein S16
MLRIRLSRTGKKRQASYRVVVTDVDAKRDGRIVERIGHYDPRSTALEYMIDENRALYWLSVGAQPSDAVRRLLERQGTYGRLGRLHKGESFDALVAEFQGTELPQAEMAPLAAAGVPAEAAAAAVGMADVEAAAAVAAVTEMAEALDAGATREEE